MSPTKAAGMAFPCAITALALTVACSREADSSAARKRAPAAAAAAASVPEPSDIASAQDNAAVVASADAPKQIGSAPTQLAATTAPELLAQLRAAANKGTLVTTWATWCGPCRRELPMLQALSVNLKPQGVQIVLVSVDDAKDRAKAASYLKDNGITLPSYMVAGEIADFKAGIDPEWPGMLPASFLFDRAARLVHFWGGEAFENEITPVIDDFLAGRAVAPETRYGLAPGKLE
jgi:thiol-disulfide isomerase/thioredoxin